jgi:hypothetical protein
MNPFSIRTQTALALFVAAALPTAAHSAGYKPFVSDFPQAQGSAASHYSAAALDAMGARYDAAAKADKTQTAASHLSPAAVKAMGARYDAAAKAYATKSHVTKLGSTTTGYVVGGKLVAQGHSFKPDAQATASPDQPVRPDDRGGIRGIDDAPAAAATSSTSFDWTDAGIGAASGLGLSLLIVGGLVLGLTTRRQHGVAPA